MPSKRNPVVYLQDILTAIDRIESYIGELRFSEYEHLPEKQDGVERRLGILAKATDRLRTTNIEQNSQIDWRAIHNLGNVLRHEYNSIDLKRIWKIVHDDLPEPRRVVEAMLRESFPDSTQS